MVSADDSEVLDLLYGAAVQPSLWGPAIERVADMVGAGAACLSEADIVTGLGLSEIVRVDTAMASQYLDHYADINVLLKVSDPDEYARTWSLKVLTDEDWMPKDAFVRGEYYNDFLKPQDIHHVLMIRLALSGSQVASLSINRGRAHEQFGTTERETIARLHPHLIRAFKLGKALAADRLLDQQAADVFDGSAQALYLVDRDARVLRVNRAGEALLRAGAGLSLAGGRLGARVPAISRRLEALIASTAARDGASRGGGSIAVSSPSRHLPLLVNVLPIQPALTPFAASNVSAMVCVTDLEADVALPEQRLRDIFGLTPTEARVALALFNGAHPNDIADQRGVSPFTVRTQMTRIFEKTGANRQSELMRLMMRCVGSGA